MEISLGASIKNVGSSTENKTGNWRSIRPVFDKKKCTQCMICWMYCPDMAIPQKLGKEMKSCNTIKIIVNNPGTLYEYFGFFS